jgi:hypothetical protein
MVTDNLLALLKINSSKRTSKFSRSSSRLPSLILSRTSTILVDAATVFNALRAIPDFPRPDSSETRVRGSFRLRQNNRVHVVTVSNLWRGHRSVLC